MPKRSQRSQRRPNLTARFKAIGQHHGQIDGGTRRAPGSIYPSPKGCRQGARRLQPAAGGFRGRQSAHHAGERLPPAAGHEGGDPALAYKVKFHAIALTARQQGERRGQISSDVEFAGGAGNAPSVLHRRRCIDHQVQPQAQRDFPFAQEVAVRPRKKLPVDLTGFIPRLIGPVLAELPGLARLPARMQARHHARHEATRPEL